MKKIIGIVLACMLAGCDNPSSKNNTIETVAIPSALPSEISATGIWEFTSILTKLTKSRSLLSSDHDKECNNPFPVPDSLSIREDKDGNVIMGLSDKISGRTFPVSNGKRLFIRSEIKDEMKINYRLLINNDNIIGDIVIITTPKNMDKWCEYTYTIQGKRE